jgi:hypothetical protein
MAVTNGASLSHPDRSGGIARRLRRAGEHLVAVTNTDSCTLIQAELFERGVQRPYERQLLASPPALDLLLAVNGGEWLIKYLVVNQPLDSIFFAETVGQFVLVFIQPAFQVRSNADLQNSAAAREDIDVKLAHRLEL